MSQEYSDVRDVGPGPHVVLVMDRDPSVDRRARNIAWTLTQQGARVTMLGRSRSKKRVVTVQEGLRALHVPVVAEIARDKGSTNSRGPVVGWLLPRVPINRRHLIRLRQGRRFAQRHLATVAAAGRLGDPWLRTVGGLVERVAAMDERLGDRLQARSDKAPPISQALVLPRSLPDIGDVELAFGPVLDSLDADVLHAMDVRSLAAVVSASTRAAARGRQPGVVYDATEGQLSSVLEELEARCVSRIDRVTVADEHVEGRLAKRLPSGVDPVVISTRPRGTVPLHRDDIRRAVGVADHCLLVAVLVPGKDDVTVVQMIAGTDWHAAVVMDSLDRDRLPRLAGLASDAGVSAQIHTVGLPPGDEHTGYLRAADVILVGAINEMQRSAAVGEAMLSATPWVDLVSEIDPASLRSTVAAKAQAGGRSQQSSADVAPTLWEDHEDQLAQVYRPWLSRAEAVVGRLSVAKISDTNRSGSGSRQPDPDASIPGTFAIGPRNGNGQPWEWSRALSRVYPQIVTEVFAVQYRTGRLDMSFPANTTITVADWSSLDWQLGWTKHLLMTASHVLIEQGLSVLGLLNGATFEADLAALRQHDVTVGLVFRGSEIRDPAMHAGREPWSPFADPEQPLTRQLQQQVGAMRRAVDLFDGQRFVTTLDLLDDVPGAAWLPHTIDADLWKGGRPPLSGAEPPIVVHAPTRAAMKGSGAIDEVCQRLDAAGQIRYRRLRGIPYSKMPATLAEVDIVVDQMAIGSYGVLALQALAAGRVVVGHVAQRVRDRLPVNLPIIEATPDTLEEVLRRLIADRASSQEHAVAGERYVQTFHSGGYSVAQLAVFLGLHNPFDWKSLMVDARA